MLRKQATMQKQASFQMKFLEVKTTADGRIRIKGFASTPQIDRYDDIVNPAAFANAMSQYMTNPVILLGHNPDKVLGKVIEYNLSNEGLEITAELSNDIDNTFHNIMEKNLRGFSIGFICKAANYREDGNRDIREITELDLVEISVVSTPANPSSLFTLAKSLRLLFAEAEQKEAEDIAAAETPAPVAEETPAPETPTTPEEEEKGKTKCKTCGKMHDGECDPEDIQSPEDPETDSSKKDIQTDPKTEKEAPAGETPATPETVDVPATDKSEPVKAGEETPETPAPVAGLTEEEAKSLIEAAVQEAIAPVAKALEDIAKAYKDLEEKHTKLTEEHKQLESDVLKIEVRPGKVATRATTPTQRAPLTDAMVLRSIGL